MTEILACVGYNKEQYSWNMAANSYPTEETVDNSVGIWLWE